MVDIVVSIPNLQAAYFQDGQAAGTITPQYMRDLILSLGTALGVRLITVAGAIGSVPTDRVIIVNKTVPASSTVALLASPATGQALTVKDGAGNCATFPIVITPNLGTIDGLPSFTLNVNYASVDLVYNGVQWSIL